jgi:hypothetical protein
LSRPGYVLEVDRSTPPVLFHHGEGFSLERLPIGSRVIYPPEPVKALPDPDAAVRRALLEPLGMDPLPAYLRPGMRLTIAFDDISLPLPPMKGPDNRQRVIEAVLDLAAAAGVDDVELISATALHRRMTDPELKHAVGKRVFDAFAPHGLLYNHDAEDPDGMELIGHTEEGERVEINKRAATSDLLVYVNINLVPMDGGHKSVAVGLCDYESLRAHHEPQTIIDSDSYMDPARSMLNTKVVRQGRLVDEHLNVFHIETALNNRMYTGQMDIFARNEDEFSSFDRMKFESVKWSLKKLPWAARRKLLHSIPAAYELIACHAGRTEPVHERILEKCFAQYAVEVKGQCDVLVVGVPYISPYNVYSILNPLLVQVMGLGYYLRPFSASRMIRTVSSEMCD